LGWLVPWPIGPAGVGTSGCSADGDAGASVVVSALLFSVVIVASNFVGFTLISSFDIAKEAPLNKAKQNEKIKIAI